METVLIIVLVSVTLIVGVLGFRLFQADPNPTVSDPLGVPKVARVSGMVGTVSDGSAGTKPVVATVATAPSGTSDSTTAATRASGGGVAGTDGPLFGRSTAPASTSGRTTGGPTAAVPAQADAATGITNPAATATGSSDLDLPGLFAIDTGAGRPLSNEA